MLLILCQAVKLHDLTAESNGYTFFCLFVFNSLNMFKCMKVLRTFSVLFKMCENSHFFN